VEVLAVLQRADINRLSYFSQDFGIQPSYDLLVDPEDSVASLYGLTLNPTIIIIDKSGLVCYTGKFIPWTDIAEEIESISGEVEEVDLSTTDLAIKALKAPENATRWKAASVLGDIGDESAVPYLADALKDESAAVREFAVEALGKIGSESAIEPLITALDDKSDLVRQVAIKVLVNTKDERAIPALMKCLPNRDLQQDASNALMEYQPELVSKALDDVINALSTEKAWMKDPICEPLGMAYQQRGMYDVAISVYSKVAETATDKTWFSTRMAECYAEKGAFDQAVTEYLKAIRNTQSSDQPMMFMSSSDGTLEKFTEIEWIFRQFVNFFSQPDIAEKATKAFESMSDSSAQDVVFCEAIGSLYDAQGMYQKAIPFHEQVLKTNPNDVKEYAKLVSAYIGIDMMDKAVATVKEMSSHAKTDADSQIIMAKAYLDCKMYDDAISAYKKAISISTGDWYTTGYQFGLVNCYVGAGKYPEAIAEYEDIIKSTKDSFWQNLAENRMWDLYVKANLYDLAMQKCTAMVEADPKDAKAHEYLARIYEAKDQPEKVIAEYEQITVIKPYDATAFEVLGDSCKKCGNLDKAISSYERSLLCDPTNNGVHEKLGDLYTEKDMNEEALDEYKKSQTQALASIEQGTTDAMVYNNLAWFYVQKKINPLDSVTLAEKANGLSPENLMFMDTLGWAYMRNAQFDKALETFLDVLTHDPNYQNTWNGVSEITIFPVEPEKLSKFGDDVSKIAESRIDAQEKNVINARMHDVLGRFYSYRGDKEKALTEWSLSGFIADENWLVVGPFDNTNGNGFSEAYPPEKKIDLTATYQGKGKDASWIEVNDEIADAYIDLYKIYDKAEWAVAYALARVNSPADREVYLRIGSDDDVKVWLNGKKVLSVNVPRPIGIDQNIVLVTLKSGANDILVKVCNRTSYWGFYMRITDRDGKPYDDLHCIPAYEFKTQVVE
jgi:tetratricopeptide (TPR) repeat protein